MMTENIKAVVEYGVELSQKQQVTYEIDGKIYFDRDRANLTELEPIKRAAALSVNTLSGLVGYIKRKFDHEENQELLINVEEAAYIKVYSQLDADRKRESLIDSKAVLDRFPYGQFIDSEQFIIKIQSLFQRTDNADRIINLASSIRINEGSDLTDNGISQQVTVRQGVDVRKEEVPNPIELKPFRTFLEVDQPESAFVFRLDKQGRCALFEADGGIWKNEAMYNIREYLEEELAEEIANGYVTVIA